MVSIGGTRYRAYEWAELDPPTPRPAPPARASEASALLGRVHQMRLPADGEVDDWYTMPAPASELSALGERAVAEGRPWADAFVAALPGVERLRLDPDRSWTMTVSTGVNFLAVMAEQAMADDEHRGFAERQLHELCHGAFDEVLASIETLSPLFD